MPACMRVASLTPEASREKYTEILLPLLPCGPSEEALLGRACMPLEALEPRKRDRVLHHGLRILLAVDPHPGASPQESVDRQTARVTGGSGRWEHVVGAAAVVSQHLGGVPADKEAAVVGALHADLHCVLGHDLEVFGCDLVAYLQRQMLKRGL